MLNIHWKIWLAVWLGIVAATAGLASLLGAQDAPNAMRWTGAVGGLFGNAWVVFGLVRWHATPWVKRINTFVLVTLGYGVLAGFFWAVGSEPGLRTALSLYLAVVGFLLGINLLRLLLRPGYPVLGVARTMLEESLRMGVALIFIVGLLVILVIMPLVLGSEDRVTYMVQRFLTYATAVVSVLLSLMTVLLSARSVSLEFSSKQAHMTLTKPLARWQYLAGKWLGVMLLNAVLLGVAGVAIYGFTTAIATNPALNDVDRYAVDREVLTARQASTPDPVGVTWEQMIQNVLRDKQERDPQTFGNVGDAIGTLSETASQEVMSETISGFFTVDGGTSQDYQFTGLANAVAAADRSVAKAERLLMDEAGLSADEAAQYAAYVVGRPSELEAATVEKVSADLADQVIRILERDVIQLVLHPDLNPDPDDHLVELLIRLNNRPWPRPPALGMPAPRQKLVIETPNELAIPAGMIDRDGTLVVTIEVPAERVDGTPQPYMQFNPKDAQIQLFYRVGSFEANLARSMLVIWIKLGFLAMLGLVLGTLLSFPVAALFGLMVYVAAAASGVIDESLNDYVRMPKDAQSWELITATLGTFFTHIGRGEIYDAFRVLIRVSGESFMLVIPSFGEYATAEPLANGHIITNRVIGGAAFKIGLVWTGVVALLGLYLFNRKEVARVTV